MSDTKPIWQMTDEELGRHALSGLAYMSNAPPMYALIGARIRQLARPADPAPPETRDYWVSAADDALHEAIDQCDAGSSERAWLEHSHWALHEWKQPTPPQPQWAKP